MRKKLGEILIASGSVTQADIDLALMDQASGDASRLGEQLIGLGKLTPRQLAKALSQQHSIPLIELPPIPPDVLAAVPMELQVRHRLVPFRVSADSVSIGMADPADEHVLEELRASLNKKIMRYVVAGDAVDAAHASLGQATVELPAIAPHVAPVGARRSSAPPTAQELFETVEPPAAGLEDELFSGLDLPPPTTADVAPPPMIAPVATESAVIEIREEEEPEFYESVPVVPVAHVPPPPAIAPSPTPGPPPPGPAIFELDAELPVTTPASEGLTSSPSGSFAIDVRDSTIGAPPAAESFEVSLGSGDFGPAPAESAHNFFAQTAPPQEESVELEQLPGELNASDEPGAPLPFPSDEPPPPAPEPAPQGPKPSLPSWLGSSGSASAAPLVAAEWTGELDDVQPSRLIAGAVRVLVEKGLVTEAEILAALAKKKS
jgi:hypothetical protein